MKVAIPHWQGRISPVFDVAGNVLIVEIDGGVERSRQDVAFDVEEPQARAARLVETAADVLVCGAISRPLEMALAAAGVEVVSQTCGEVEEVLLALVSGRLRDDAFLMPGCRGRRRRYRGRRRSSRPRRANPTGRR